jgi:hypothetical protein
MRLIKRDTKHDEGSELICEEQSERGGILRMQKPILSTSLRNKNSHTHSKKICNKIGSSVSFGLNVMRRMVYRLGLQLKLRGCSSNRADLPHNLVSVKLGDCRAGAQLSVCATQPASL